MSSGKNVKLLKSQRDWARHDDIRATTSQVTLIYLRIVLSTKRCATSIQQRELKPQKSASKVYKKGAARMVEEILVARWFYLFCMPLKFDYTSAQRKLSTFRTLMHALFTTCRSAKSLHLCLKMCLSPMGMSYNPTSVIDDEILHLNSSMKSNSKIT